MKMPLDWHRNCLTDARANLASEERNLAMMISRVENSRKYVDLYYSQIRMAEERGLESFDSEKLGRTKGHKAS
jgi:hypothetical protein